VSRPLTGGCACGAIRYACAAEPLAMHHCHCRDCQRASGTGHGSNLMVPKAATTITGDARFYEVETASGRTAARGFCPNCGAPVYTLNSGMPDLLFLTAGSLDEPARFRPQRVYFTASAPPWDTSDPTLPAVDAGGG
jgi:hypothetical protein